MRIYYDLEFIERGPDIPLRLISIGMVREDGETLYLINAHTDISQIARHPWLAVNVWPTLPLLNPNQNILAWDEEHVDYKRVVGVDTIAEAVLRFCTEDGQHPELWAYYGAYDHVVLCQLWGTMMDLPAQMPMYTNDVMQEYVRQGRPDLPPQQSVQHHALEDALWVKEAHESLLARTQPLFVEAEVGSTRQIEDLGNRILEGFTEAELKYIMSADAVRDSGDTGAGDVDK